MSYLYCRVGDCTNLSERNGLCATHRKRKQRGQQLDLPVIEPYRTPKERVWEAAIAVLDTDSEDDAAYSRAEERFWNAIDALLEERSRNLSPTRSRMGA